MTAPDRPLSPHLGIYRRQYTMVLSVLHRATGVALSAGLVLLVWWLLAVAGGEERYRALAAFLAAPLGLVLLAGLTAGFWYHFVAGIRHLVFDTGRALERREARRSALVVVLASGLLTVATFAFVLHARGLV